MLRFVFFTEVCLKVSRRLGLSLLRFGITSISAGPDISSAMWNPCATQRGLRHQPNEKNVNKGHLGLFSPTQYESKSLREPLTCLAFRPEGR